MKYSSKDIAVCILFYNKIEQTIKCIESFLPSNVKIYLLNNGSDPAQFKDLEKYVVNHNIEKQIILLNAAENLGVSGGRNKLINSSIEQWLFFVDNDITIHTPNWKIQLLDLINSNDSSTEPIAEVFIPKLYNKHEHIYSREVNLKIKADKVDFQTVTGTVSNTFPGGAAIISRSLFKRLGLYETSMFVGFEDFELAIRALTIGAPIRCRFIRGIELIHDHIFQTRAADKQSVAVRYNYDHIRNSYDYVLKKYHLVLDPDFKPWLDEQVRQLTVKENRTLKIIKNKSKYLLKRVQVQFKRIIKR